MFHSLNTMKLRKKLKKIRCVLRARSATFVAFIGQFVALGGQFDIMETQYRSNVCLDILLVAPN